MADERKNRVKLGIFVSLAVIVFIIGVISVGNQSKLFVSTFPLMVEFSDAGGLQGGENVWFSGVKVGTVKKVTILEEDRISVEMALEEKLRPFIKKDAIAKISSDGFIGNTIIVILGGSKEVASVEPGDTLASEQAIDTDNMMATLQKNNENLVGITEKLDEILDGIRRGEGSIGMMFKDTSLYYNINQAVSGLNEVKNAALKLTKELEKTTDLLNSEEGMVYALFKDEELTESLKRTIATLEQTSTQAETISKDLKILTEKLNAPGNTMDLLLEDKEFANSLKNTLEYLEGSSEKLDENMLALRSNFLFRRYFRKLEKQQGN
jgi:phospholipid/cholesterol/gamma-HCH transport system substrate-binding protein